MQKLFIINGRLMQRQPCQQQQSAFLGLGAPAPSKTLIAGVTPPLPPPGLVPDATGRVPARDDYTIAWIKQAAGQRDFDPYTYLSNARNYFKLDKLDDNLAAAERYYDALQGNINEGFILGDLAVKDAREVPFRTGKVMEKVLGKNGAKDGGFVTKWGLTGAFDRRYGITDKNRVELGAPGPNAPTPD